MAHKLLIIGAGPAGFTAGIYAARASLAPVLYEGDQPGGQLTTTTEVENWPGVKKSILGTELVDLMREQAKSFGTTVISETVTKVDLSSSPKKIWIGEKVEEADAVIIATGASAKRLGLESEKALYGKGVSACATCDGFFFKEKEVVVVGGGDSAMEEANFLTKFASKVTILVRSETLRASKIMADRAKANPKIKFIWNIAVEEVLGVAEGRVTGVRLKDLKTGETCEMACQGVFAAIGHAPNTKLFEGQLELDKVGYIVMKDRTSATNVPGVFAAGDVMDARYRQAVTAAGSGCAAALDVQRYLEEMAHA